MDQRPFAWTTLEYEFKEKGPDWMWSFGIIAVSAVAVAVLIENYLLAVLLTVSAFALLLNAFRRPNKASFEVNRSGIVIGKLLYPYASLESFWVEQNDPRPKLIVKSKKLLMPFIILPLGDTDPQDIREFMSGFLKEEEHREPAFQKIMEHFGF